MKKFILSLSLAGLLLGASSCTEKSASEANNAALVPIPQESVFENQYFTLSQSTVICAGQNDELKNIAQFFNNKIEPAFGFKLDVKEKGDITFSLIDDETLGNEGYKLKITSGGIEISAYKPAGIFYGVQSVLQMLPKEVKSPSKVDNIKWTVQCGEITDKPQFPWRGIMFDVSRHFFTKEKVMKLID